MKEVILTAAMLAFITTAPRDGTYVIPGQRPTYITPRGGAYVIQTPMRGSARNNLWAPASQERSAVRGQQ
jgi:hypothetical protein